MMLMDPIAFFAKGPNQSRRLAVASDVWTAADPLFLIEMAVCFHGKLVVVEKQTGVIGKHDVYIYINMYSYLL